MPQTTIDRLIVNSPYEEPARHWRYDRTTRMFDLAKGRRPAGYGFNAAAAQDVADGPAGESAAPDARKDEIGGRARRGRLRNHANERLADVR